MALFPSHLIKKPGVRPDWFDRRDHHYAPKLSILRDEMSMDTRLIPFKSDVGMKVPLFGVRHQGQNPRCVGYALANLIDIQRSLQEIRRADAGGGGHVASREAWQFKIVSADMLYWMACFHDRFPDLESQDKDKNKTSQMLDQGVLTLRSAIKGFYHHGACLDWPFEDAPADKTRWQSDCYMPEKPDIPHHFPTVEQAGSAKNIGLGAYFRLASVLNYFHAALNDAEAILVTANVHDGWLQAAPQNGGLIKWPPDQGVSGTHAFVLTGYDTDGFHVLNSWGPKWGGYKDMAGIALWPYADWAQNVVDAWVLRLGVHAPTAFGASIGEQGMKGVVGREQSGSTPCFELMGHYMHLDDGYHVNRGSYPSRPAGWTRTCDFLKDKMTLGRQPSKHKKQYRGLLVWLPGSLEGIKSAFSAAVARKARIEKLDLYPYTVFWCNSFVEKSLEVLQSLFDTCREQAGDNAAHLDELIETRVRGVGRALWRDIEMSARRGVRGTTELPFEDPDERDRIDIGFIGCFLRDILRIRKETGCELHLVAEGAGALVVHEMLALMESGDPKLHGVVPDDMTSFCDTLHLIHPAIGLPRAKKLLLPQIGAMNGTNSGKRKQKSRARSAVVTPLIDGTEHKPARIYVPTDDLEDRVRFGAYSKSILHLVSHAFEDRYPLPKTDAKEVASHLLRPRPFLGMADMARNDEVVNTGALFRLNQVADQKHNLDRIEQSALQSDPTITQHIFDCIKEFQTPKT